jgi:hypothetical protein
LNRGAGLLLRRGLAPPLPAEQEPSNGGWVAVVMLATASSQTAEVGPPMDRKFICSECGHEIVFDPAKCLWSLTVRPVRTTGKDRL